MSSLPKALEDRPIQENVVPAYPYDDALFALFHNSLVDASGSVNRRNGVTITYNRDLFLPRMVELRGRAAAVACLYEHIILAPRPAELPDFDTYSKEGGYSHPDLRIKMPFEAPPQFGKYTGVMEVGDDDVERYSEWDHLEGIAIELRTKRPIKSFFARHKDLFPGITFIDLTINTIVQAYLARKYNAVLLGDEVFREFYWLLRTTAPASMELFPGIDEETAKTSYLGRRDVEAFSLDFTPATLDAFAEIRMDKDIWEYGVNWRRIIATSPPDQLRENLLTEMARANELRRIAGKIAGVFSFVGTVLTWLGLIPGTDAVSTYGGVLVDLAGKGASKRERRLSWCTIGAKMHWLAQQATLRKFLNQKREGRQLKKKSGD